MHRKGFYRSECFFFSSLLSRLTLCALQGGGLVVEGEKKQVTLFIHLSSSFMVTLIQIDKLSIKGSAQIKPPEAHLFRERI